MIIYFSIFALIFVSQFFFPNHKAGRNLVVSILAIFFCFSYMNGSDWRQYEIAYKSDFGFDLLGFEPGFVMMMKVFSFVEVDFWWFFIILKLICFYLFLNKIKDYLPTNFFNGVGLFLSFFGLYLFIDCPLRNLIAVTIALYSIPYLINKNFKKFLLIVLIASLFHISSLVLIILYFVSSFNASKKKIIISYFLFYLVLAIFNTSIVNTIVDSLGNIPFVGLKINNYFGEDNEFSSGNVFTFGLLLRSLLFIILVTKKDIIIKKYGLVFFNQIVIFFFLYRLSITFPIFMRFTLFYSIFFVVGTTMLFNIYHIKYRPIVYSLFYFYLFSNVYLIITSSYKYIPYTNYLEYIFKEKPDYNYRYHYNRDTSPYLKD